MDMIPVMFTSAAVGAAISSIVTAISQHYERRMRRGHWFRFMQINLCSSFKQFFESRIFHVVRNRALEFLKPPQVPYVS